MTSAVGFLLIVLVLGILMAILEEVETLMEPLTKTQPQPRKKETNPWQP